MIMRVLFACAALLAAGPAFAASLPPIIADAGNHVPKCIKPDALMDFVNATNSRRRTPWPVAPRFHNIADLYERIGSCVERPPGKCVAIRWDYAFFQMLIETNYLTFRRPSGAPAGVPASDNNFAGLGATVSGRPGEHFDDVETGVLAHLQHVLMYSATPVPHPVAKRTRLVQNDVQAYMRRLKRPVTFADLARQWTGVDQSGYARNMRALHDKFTQTYCGNQKLTAR